MKGVSGKGIGRIGGTLHGHKQRADGWIHYSSPHADSKPANRKELTRAKNKAARQARKAAR